MICVQNDFVNKIYLYDGDEPRAEIYCNASEKSINCTITPISEIDINKNHAINDTGESSSMARLAPPAGIEPATSP